MALANFLWFASNHPVSRRDPVGTAARIGHWQLVSRLKQGPIVRPWLGDLQLSVERGMTSATGNIYYGLHDFHPMAFLAHYLRADDLFVDLGANVGTYSLLAASHGGAQVIAVEASPVTAGFLRENVRLNGLANRIEVHQCAAGRGVGEIAFSVNEGAANHVVAKEGSQRSDVQMVPMSSVDLILAGRQPAMLKLDVEGYEDEVIAGAIETLGASTLRAIQLESAADVTIAALERLGFSPRWYDAIARDLLVSPCGPLPGDPIYVRDEAFVRDRLKSARTLDVAGLRL